MNPVNIQLTDFFNVHFNIISTSRFSRCSLSFRYPCQNRVCISLRLRICHFSCSGHAVNIGGVSTDYETPPCVVFSTALFPRPALAQISSSEPRSRTPSTCIPSSVSATKFHTHTGKLIFQMRYCLWLLGIVWVLMFYCCLLVVC